MTDTFENFMEEWMKRLQEQAENYGMKAELADAVKNNGKIEKRIKVWMPGTNMAPLIDPMPFYEKYLESGDIKEAVDSILNFAWTVSKNQLDIPELLSKENILDNTYLKVINTAVNQDLLKHTPHFLLAGGELAAIPRLNIKMDENSGTVIIRDELLPRLQMTGEELLEIAKDNTESQNLFEVNTLLGTLINIMQEEGKDIADDFSQYFTAETPRVVVMSNKDRLYGASCLACPKVLDTAIQMLGMDCYILPSSIHEVILIEKTGEPGELEALREMVKEVNRTEVAPEDVLSDKVFQFNTFTKRLGVALTEQEAKTLTKVPRRGTGLHI